MGTWDPRDKQPEPILNLRLEKNGTERVLAGWGAAQGPANVAQRGYVQQIGKGSRDLAHSPLFIHFSKKYLSHLLNSRHCWRTEDTDMNETGQPHSPLERISINNYCPEIRAAFRFRQGRVNREEGLGHWPGSHFMKLGAARQTAGEGTSGEGCAPGHKKAHLAEDTGGRERKVRKEGDWPRLRGLGTSNHRV